MSISDEGSLSGHALVSFLDRIYEKNDGRGNLDPLDVTWIKFDKIFAHPFKVGEEVQAYLVAYESGALDSKDTNYDPRHVAFDMMLAQLENVEDETPKEEPVPTAKSIEIRFWFQILLELLSPCKNLATIDFPIGWITAELEQGDDSRYNKFPRIDVWNPRQRKRRNIDDKGFWRIGRDPEER